MNSLFIIDDNFLTEEKINEIAHRTYSTKWGFRQDIGAASDGIGGVFGGDYSDYPFFVSSPLIDNNQEISNICREILSIFCIKHNLKIKNIFRERSNISTTTLDLRTSRPHTDTLDKDQYIFLYYINNSDGDTILYNEFSNGEIFFTSENITVAQNISPKAGKALLFPARQFHSWSAPKNNSFRAVLNMNVSFEVDNRTI